MQVLKNSYVKIAHILTAYIGLRSNQGIGHPAITLRETTTGRLLCHFGRVRRGMLRRGELRQERNCGTQQPRDAEEPPIAPLKRVRNQHTPCDSAA